MTSMFFTLSSSSQTLLPPEPPPFCFSVENHQGLRDNAEIYNNKRKLNPLE